MTRTISLYHPIRRQITARGNRVVSHSSASAVRKLLTASGGEQTLIWCHFADLKKGLVDFGKNLDKHNPDACVTRSR